MAARAPVALRADAARECGAKVYYYTQSGPGRPLIANGRLGAELSDARLWIPVAADTPHASQGCSSVAAAPTEGTVDVLVTSLRADAALPAWATGADVAFGLSVILGGLALYYFVHDPLPPSEGSVREARDWAFAPMVDPVNGGASLGFVGRF